MIKKEVVTPETNEAPVWLARIRGALLNGPALVVLGVVVVIGIAVVLWLHYAPASNNETGPQSQPVQGQQLQVVVSGGTIGAQGTTGSSASGTVGPAPANSLNSLQPTGTTQGSTGGQSLGQTGNVQSAGTANQSSLNSSSL